MTARVELVRDLTIHLLEDIRAIERCHMQLAIGASVTETEWSAVTMAVAERLLVEAVGVLLTVSDTGYPLLMFDATAQKIMKHLYARRDQIIQIAEVASKVSVQ